MEGLGTGEKPYRSFLDIEALNQTVLPTLLPDLNQLEGAHSSQAPLWSCTWSVWLAVTGFLTLPYLSLSWELCLHSAIVTLYLENERGGGGVGRQMPLYYTGV